MRLDGLNKRVDRLTGQVEGLQLARAGHDALAIVQASLARKFAIINPDGTFPDDFSEQCEQVDQDQTPAERAAVAQFQRLYHCAGAKEALLRRLEQAAGSEDG